MRRRRTRNKEERRRLELQRRRVRDESRRRREGMEEDETGDEHIIGVLATVAPRSVLTADEIEAYIVREFRRGTLRSGVVNIRRANFLYNVERFIYVIGTIFLCW